MRADDAVGRLGGEEFCVVLPGSDERQAQEVAERLRARCERGLVCVSQHSTNVTISIGSATLTADNATFVRLVKDADAALYEAKALGRNRVVHARDMKQRIAIGDEEVAISQNAAP